MAEETKKLLPSGVHENGDIDWPLTFKLSKNIVAFDDDVSALEIREPTANDVIKHGLLSGGVYGDGWLDLLVDLTQIPKASLGRMSGKDIMRLSNILARFFSQAAD